MPTITSHVQEQDLFPSGLVSFNVLAVNIQEITGGATYKLPLGLFPDIKQALQFAVDNTPPDYNMVVLCQSGQFKLLRDALATDDLPVFSAQLTAIVTTPDGLRAFPVAMRHNETYTPTDAAALISQAMHQQPAAVQLLTSPDVLRTVISQAGATRDMLPVMKSLLDAYRARWKELTSPANA